MFKLGSSKYFKEDYKRFFCEGEDKEYIQEVKLEILKELIDDNSFDDIFNELSNYLHQPSGALARQSVLVIG